MTAVEKCSLLRKLSASLPREHKCLSALLRYRMLYIFLQFQ